MREPPWKEVGRNQSVQWEEVSRAAQKITTYGLVLHLKWHWKPIASFFIKIKLQPYSLRCWKHKSARDHTYTFKMKFRFLRSHIQNTSSSSLRVVWYIHAYNVKTLKRTSALVSPIPHILSVGSIFVLLRRKTRAFRWTIMQEKVIYKFKGQVRNAASTFHASVDCFRKCKF